MGIRFSEGFVGEALRLDPSCLLLQTASHRSFHRGIKPLLHNPSSDVCRTTGVLSQMKVTSQAGPVIFFLEASWSHGSATLRKERWNTVNYCTSC